MFFRKKRSAGLSLLPTYAKYVIQKVAPSMANQRDLIVSTAEKAFPQGVYERGAELALVKYGHATSQVISLAFAAAIKQARGGELEDIEYGDCALAASFIMRGPLRNLDEAQSEIIEDWIESFGADMQYLVFATNETLSDLIEAGNERFLYYETNASSKIPDAYLHLLSQVMRQRVRGEWEPYRLLDPMSGPDPIVFMELLAVSKEVEVLIENWVNTVRDVQEIADRYRLDVWSWW